MTIRTGHARDVGALARAARVATVLALGLVSAACASGPFASSRNVTREKAIANCIESTPAESVMYADVFAACMERQGWAYSLNSG